MKLHQSGKTRYVSLLNAHQNNTATKYNSRDRATPELPQKASGQNVQHAVSAVGKWNRILVRMTEHTSR